MCDENVRPDTIAFDVAISASEKGRQWQSVVALLKTICGGGMVSIFNGPMRIHAMALSITQSVLMQYLLPPVLAPEYC